MALSSFRCTFANITSYIFLVVQILAPDHGVEIHPLSHPVPPIFRVAADAGPYVSFAGGVEKIVALV